jgi:hypothetical protein
MKKLMLGTMSRSPRPNGRSALMKFSYQLPESGSPYRKRLFAALQQTGQCVVATHGIRDDRKQPLGLDAVEAVSGGEVDRARVIHRIGRVVTVGRIRCGNLLTHCASNSGRARSQTTFATRSHSRNASSSLTVTHRPASTTMRPSMMTSVTSLPLAL